MFPDGKVLLVANPVAQIGRGKAAGSEAADLLRGRLGEERVELRFTESAQHASELVEECGSAFSTIVGLGGDGVMHEIAQGLMRIPVESRPVFGVIPVGSGNDYARSLGMSADLRTSVGQLVDYPARLTDVGCCNGVYFLETLSFGVDAAIALGTEERRVRTGHTGTRLYLEEGIDQMLHHLVARPTSLEFESGCKVVYDGKAIAQESKRVSSRRTNTLLLTVQVGPTYGGGFHITPAAQLDDGVFDICLARGPLSPMRATYIFLRAKDGNHTKYDIAEFYRASGVRLDFECETGDVLPAQIDGERIGGTSFEIVMHPRSLSVIRRA